MVEKPPPNETSRKRVTIVARFGVLLCLLLNPEWWGGARGLVMIEMYPKGGESPRLSDPQFGYDIHWNTKACPNVISIYTSQSSFLVFKIGTLVV